MKRLIELMRKAADSGARVCVIGSDMPCTMVPVGSGMFYFRNHSPAMLSAIQVDIVWFVDPPSPEVENLGVKMTCLSKDPVIMRGYRDGT